MPQISISYTKGLRDHFDVQALVDAVHEAALGCGVFPPGGVRTLALEAQASRAGPGDGAHLHIAIRIAPGRSAEARRMVAERLFAAADACLAKAFARQPMGLQLELTEFDPALTLSRNTMIEASSAGKPVR